MAATPPFDRRALKKQGLLNEDTFYKKLAANCNYVDEKTVRDFYLALVKTITQEIRQNSVARLPHLGDFALVQHKPKYLLAGPGRIRKLLSMRNLRFYPTEKWRMYFNMQEHQSNGTQV